LVRSLFCTTCFSSHGGDDDDDERIFFNVAVSPKTATTRNKLTIAVKSRSSQCNETFLVRLRTAVRPSKKFGFQSAEENL